MFKLQFASSLFIMKAWKFDNIGYCIIFYMHAQFVKPELFVSMKLLEVIYIPKKK